MAEKGDTELERCLEAGLAYYEKGSLDRAVAAWRRAAELDPSDERARAYMDYVQVHHDALTSMAEPYTPWAVGSDVPSYRIGIAPFGGVRSGGVALTSSPEGWGLATDSANVEMGWASGTTSADLALATPADDGDDDDAPTIEVDREPAVIALETPRPKAESLAPVTRERRSSIQALGELLAPRTQAPEINSESPLATRDRHSAITANPGLGSAIAITVPAPDVSEPAPPTSSGRAARGVPPPPPGRPLEALRVVAIPPLAEERQARTTLAPLSRAQQVSQGPVFDADDLVFDTRDVSGSGAHQVKASAPAGGGYEVSSDTTTELNETSLLEVEAVEPALLERTTELSEASLFDVQPITEIGAADLQPGSGWATSAAPYYDEPGAARDVKVHFDGHVDQRDAVKPSAADEYAASQVGDLDDLSETPGGELGPPLEATSVAAGQPLSGSHAAAWTAAVGDNDDEPQNVDFNDVLAEFDAPVSPIDELAVSQPQISLGLAGPGAEVAPDVVDDIVLGHLNEAPGVAGPFEFRSTPTEELQPLTTATAIGVARTEELDPAYAPPTQVAEATEKLPAPRPPAVATVPPASASLVARAPTIDDLGIEVAVLPKVSPVAMPAAPLSHRQQLEADLERQLASHQFIAESKEELVRQRIGALLEVALAALKHGDLERAVVAADLVMRQDPESAVTQKIVQRSKDAMVGLFTQYLTPLTHAPKLHIAPQAMTKLAIDARTAFLLTRVDGELTYDELLDISGMPRLEALRVLCQLKLDRVIG